MSLLFPLRLQRYASFPNPLRWGNTTSSLAKPVLRCFWGARVN